MSRTDPSFEMLSAYVDGELDGREAEDIARLVATDEKVAHCVSRLFDIKGEVARLGPDAVGSRVARRRLRPRGLAPFGVAAAVGMLVLMIWTGAIPPISDPPEVRPVLARAVALHDLWMEISVDRPVPDGSGFTAPELTAAGLRLVMVQTDLGPEAKPVIHAGYAGRNGCRLSLFEFPKPDTGPFTIERRGNLRSATWSTGTAGYVAVARNMDATRFSVVADALRAMTIRKSRPDGHLVARLRKARQPCTA